MRYGLFFFLAAAVVAIGIGGCAGEGKSYDPRGTDSLAFGDSSGSPVLQIDTNGAVQLTATVKDAAGKAVAERELTFEFVTNASGATISSTRVNTNALGEATILYRAGAAAGFDVVRAFISNGTRMDVSITVGGGIGGAQISLAAAPASLAAGQNSILTATVTDAAGSPLKGQVVTFAFTTNNSGATLVTVNGTTDVSGKAIAVYTAGTANPTKDVPDTVLASVAGSANAIVITRTADGGAGGITVKIASETTSVAAGQIAIITATVTDGANVPVIGQTVAFIFSANNSGATLLVLNGTTDVSGQAIAQYTAGANSPTISVNDTVLARIAGSAAAVVITRTVGTATGFKMEDVTADPTSLAAGATSIIVATVTNADGTAAPGQTVTFLFANNMSGATLSPINGGITDVSGKALAIYTAGALSPTLIVQDAVIATATGTAGAVIITRQAELGVGNRISFLTAFPSALFAPAGTSVVTATVVAGDDVTPVPGVPVTFSIVAGVGTVTPTAVTGNDGKAIAVFTGTAAAIDTQSVVQATIDGGTAVVIIDWLQP